MGLIYKMHWYYNTIIKVGLHKTQENQADNANLATVEKQPIITAL